MISSGLQIARKLKNIGDGLDAKVKKEIADATTELLRHRSLFQVWIIIIRIYRLQMVRLTAVCLALYRWGPRSSMTCVLEFSRVARLL